MSAQLQLLSHRSALLLHSTHIHRVAAHFFIDVYTMFSLGALINYNLNFIQLTQIAIVYLFYCQFDVTAHKHNIEQESRAAARKPRDAASVLFC